MASHVALADVMSMWGSAIMGEPELFEFKFRSQEREKLGTYSSCRRLGRNKYY